MKNEYYFKHNDSEICYTRKYFENYMQQNDLKEIGVFEAIEDKIDGIFWCKELMFCGDGTQDYCGKQCKEYQPRNGKSGRCRHHTTQLYTHGNKLILKI